jgi:diguanylate cyclase
MSIDKQPVDPDPLQGATYVNKAESQLLNALDKTEKEKKTLQKTAVTDELTGLYNQGFWLAEVDRLSNSRNPIAVVIIDIDNLKQINDLSKEKHLAGDRYLRQMAKLLKEKFRPQDIKARIGGDEFGILIEITEPNADLNTLSDEVNERLTSGQKELKFSFGIALVSQSNNLTRAIQTADTKMYQMKNEHHVQNNSNP